MAWTRRRAKSLAAEAPSTPDRRWLGYIDRVTATTVTGWCRDLQNPGARVTVEAVAASGKRSLVVADRYREDVRQAGHGDGCHGFEIDLAPFAPADRSLTLRVGDGAVAIGRPVPLDPYLALLEDELPPAFLGAMRQLAGELRRLHAEAGEAGRRGAE